MVVVSRDKARSFTDVPFLSLSKAPKGHCFLSIPFFRICSLSYPSLLVSQNPWSLWPYTLWLIRMSPLLDVCFPPLFFLTVTWLCWVAAVAHGIFVLSRGIVHSCSARVLWLWLTGSSFPCGRWDPSSLTRNQTRIRCTAKQTPNHWTTREVPPSISKEIISSQSGRCTVPLFLLFSIWWKPGFCPHHFHEMVPLEVTVTSLVTPVCLLLTVLEFATSNSMVHAHYLGILPFLCFWGHYILMALLLAPPSPHSWVTFKAFTLLVLPHCGFLPNRGLRWLFWGHSLVDLNTAQCGFRLQLPISLKILEDIPAFTYHHHYTLKCSESTPSFSQ